MIFNISKYLPPPPLTITIVGIAVVSWVVEADFVRIR